MLLTLRDRPSSQTAPGAAEREDATLVARAQGQDREAFAALYARYAAAIYGYCYSRLGERAAAEDATSLIFAKALATLPRHRGGSFRGWLFGIAHHVVADQFRARRPTAPLALAVAVVDPAPSPEELAVAADERHRLRRLLDHLPPGQRAVVELRLAGLTGAEIAQALGRSRTAVDVAQFRAVARLRVLLTDGGESCEGEVR